MAQRGRKSLASLAVASSGFMSRLAPPSTLSSAELAVWLKVVNGKPAEWFGPEHEGLLTNYVRHVVNADVIDQQVKAFNPEWLTEDAGIVRYERLLTMFRHESSMVQILARSMRLTQQAQYRAHNAGTLSDKVKGKQPWQNVEALAEANETSAGLKNTA